MQTQSGNTIGTPSAGDSTNRYGLGLLVALALTFFFFRSILPRIPSLFLRGRLRVQRIGVRGIRGIEWRSKGFGKSRLSVNAGEASSAQDEGREDSDDSGLVVKVKHIYFEFHHRSKAAKEVNHTSARNTSDEKGEGQDDDRTIPGPTSKAWLTLRVEGVGVTLPLHENGKDDEKKKTEAQEEARRQNEDSERKLKEAEEERLTYLMQSRPSSPMLNSSYGRRSGSSSPMPAFATALSQDRSSPLGRSGASFTEEEKIASTWKPWQVTINGLRYIQHVVLPTAWLTLLNLLRLLVYFLISALPFLTSIIDVEMTSIEVYMIEADAVVQFESIGLDLGMALIPLHQKDPKKIPGAQASMDCKSYSRWVSDALVSMPNRIGSGAKGAASVVTDGLPGGRMSLSLTAKGLEIFEASSARQLQSSTTSSTESRSKFTPSSLPTSTALGPGRGEPEYSSFSVLASSAPSTTLKRSRSDDNLSSVPLGDSSRRNWADWALEPLATSFDSPQTGWRRQSSAGVKENVVQPSARLLSMPGASTLKVGLVLSGTSGISSKESLHLGVELGDATVGMGALLKVLKTLESRKALRSGPYPSDRGREGTRSQVSKHFQQQQPQAQAKLLERLGSASFKWPSVVLNLSSKTSFPLIGEADDNQLEDRKLPSSMQVQSEITGIRFTIKTSNPMDESHQRWLGTCGVKNFRSPKNGNAFTDRFRWNPNHKKVAFVEHRRAFSIEAGVKSVCVKAGVDGELSEAQSQLLHLGDLAVRSRSTWTPFGLLASASESAQSAKRYFQGDPNEQSVILEVNLEKLTGDVQTRHATALIALARMHKRERLLKAREFGLEEKVPEKPTGFLDSLPKFSMGLQLEDLSYRIDASVAPNHSKHPESRSRRSEASLVVRVPRVNFAFHASYVDQYIRRGEVERKAAWKALEKDELEWSLKEDTVSKIRRRELSENGRSLPQDVAGDDREEEGKDRKESRLADGKDGEQPLQREDDDDDEEEEEEENEEYTHPETMTIKEAIKKMKELQEYEALLNQPKAQRQAFSVKKKWQKFTRQKAGLHDTCPYNTRYQFESLFTIDSVEVVWLLSGENHTSMHQTHDNTLSPSIAMRMGMPFTATHHVFTLNTFELALNGHFPGYQNIDTDAVRLDVKNSVVDARLGLEELDLDMWHKSVLEATKTLIEHMLKAVQTSPEDERRKEEEDRSSKVQDEQEVQGDLVPLLDSLRSNTSAYISIGSIIAHIGGVDERCDPSMSRGVGFEGKRTVIELACCQTEVRRSKDNTKLGLGARSALELPEDLRSPCNALATRHGKSAMFKLSLFEIGLFPLLDAELATEQHTRRFNGGVKESELKFSPNTMPGSPSIIAPAVWEFQKTRPEMSSKKLNRAKFRQQDRSNFIFWMPFSSTKGTLTPKSVVKDHINNRDEQLTIVTEGNRLFSLKIELLHTYCLLMAFASLKGLLPVKRKRDAKGKEKKQKKASRYESIIHKALISMEEIHLSVALPNNINIFIHLRRFEFTHSSKDGLAVGFESLMAAVESPQIPSNDLWEEIFRMRDFKVTMESATDGVPMKIIVNGDAASLRVPFGYTVHPIIDNAIVSVKATKQLAYQFITGKNDTIIFPVAEDPKHLPIIKLKVRILSIEAQDDPFETRLNIIWRAGGDENQARAERHFAFQEKVNQMEVANGSTLKSSASTINSYLESISSINNDEKSIQECVEDDRAAVAGGMDNLGEPKYDGKNHYNKGHSEYQSTVSQVREKLDAFNASSWIRRYTNAKAEQGRREDASLRKIYGRLPPTRQQVKLPIKMAIATHAAPLFRSGMSHVDIEIGPTSFPESKLRDFLHEQGQGTPRDLDYSLIVPLSLRFKMAEWKIDLRDYPMPLLHVPPIDKSSQPDHLPAWDLELDFCIAEQLGSHEAIRHVTAIIVPASTGRPNAIEYGISVPKMAMPVKFFGSPVITLNSCYSTRLIWGQSIQPAIHDLMRVFEGITSPPHDPSPRLGFWDKLPLIFHGRIHFRFRGEGELHLYLKGSRDPYYILEHGAGWVKCWRGNVELKINFDNEDGEVVQIISDEYLLAIPELKNYIDRAATGTGAGHHDTRRDQDQMSQHSSTSLPSSQKRYMKDPEYKKVCLKLTNGVRWGAALHWERTCTDDASCIQHVKCKGTPFHRECRFWERKPHWDVHTRSKEFAATMAPEDFGDSYRGWRTHHLHLSISIYSPKTGLLKQGSRSNRKGYEVVNNLYFTPLAWEHFFAWTRLFNSALSLPIRQGKLFPDSLAQSPKFGKHIGTIKYRFDISPLFITHVYPQSEQADWARGITTLLGVKARISCFHMDLHQRQQEITKERPELGETRTVFHKPFYEAEVDLGDIDLRTLAAQFLEPDKKLSSTSLGDGGEDFDDEDEFYQNKDNVIFGTQQDCKIPDRDLEWYDLSDFVELDWAPPVEGTPPKIRLIQAMTCPHFNYYRRLESQRERRARTRPESDDTSNTTATNCDGKTHKEVTDDDEGEEGLARLEKSKFGRESSHTCLVGLSPSPQSIQNNLSHARLDILKSELESVKKSAGEPYKKSAAAKISDLNLKIQLIETYIEMVNKIFQSARSDEELEAEVGRAAYSYFGVPYKADKTGAMDLKGLYQEWAAFDNRYFAHNPCIFYSNSTRDVLLKYYLASRKRKGVVHSLSAKAVRYIRDLCKDDDTSKEAGQKPGHSQSSKRKGQHSSTGADNGRSVPVKDIPSDGVSLLKALLRDTVQDVVSDVDGGESDKAKIHKRTTFEEEEIDPSFGISDEYEVRKSNVCILLKPQIVFKSLVDDKSTMILTALRTRMHNYSVKDPQVEEDSVNERVLHRNFFAIDGLQGFHPKKEHVALLSPTQQSRLTVFVRVPLETLVDLKYETKEFDRIAPRTNASLHYDKFNKLRLHDSSRPVVADIDSQDPAIDHLRYSMDLIRLRCPTFAILANSEQFGAIFNVVTDLVLYRDPAYQEHAKKLEVMMITYDLKDHISLASVVQALQVRIRHAKSLHIQYQLHFQHLNDQGRIDFLTLKAELAQMVDELRLILEAIQLEDDQSGSDKDKKSALRVDAQANNIAWNMMGQEEGELLAKLTIKDASFTWLNKADNSVANTMSITDLNAVNVGPNAVFTEIITKYHKVEDHPMKEKGMLLNAMWSVLAPVGGIPIMDHLELSLHPLRLQLEKKIGRQLEDYIFGSKREREKKDREQKEAEEAIQERLEGKASNRSSPFAFKRLAKAIKGSNNGKAESVNATGGGQLPDKRRGELLQTSKEKSLSAKSSSSDIKSIRAATYNAGGQNGSGSSSSSNHINGNGGEDHSSDSDSDETSQYAIAARDALEMRNRASKNLTFVYAKLSETIFCLSYKGEKQKSITDLYDLEFKAPRLEYRNRTWAFANLASHLKRDILKAAWSQRSSLLKGVIHHRRPRHQAVADNLRAIRDGGHLSTRKLLLGASESGSGGSSTTSATLAAVVPLSNGNSSRNSKEVFDGHEIEKQESARSHRNGHQTSSFVMNVEPPVQNESHVPDSTVTEKDVVEGKEENRGEQESRVEAAIVHHSQAAANDRGEFSSSRSSSPSKLSNFISKRLEGVRGKRSSFVVDQRESAPKKTRSKTEEEEDDEGEDDDDDDVDDDGGRVALLEEVRQEQAADRSSTLDGDADSDSQGEYSDDDDDDDDDGYGAQNASSNDTAASPAPSPLKASFRRANGNGASESNIGPPSSLRHSVSKINFHSPWYSNKESNDSVPKIQNDSTEEEKSKALLGVSR
ncbi:hypothetical protein CBS101457_006021 [Exobasidium rhododendri]|nr:hypothetical protein CBS101457_006021 [Exobasidium rhododendri]